MNQQIKTAPGIIYAIGVIALTKGNIQIEVAQGVITKEEFDNHIKLLDSLEKTLENHLSEVCS